MNLYVGNLARDASEEDLRQVFEAYGTVTSVNIIKDRLSGESRGFGFVEMSSKDEATKAMEGAQGADIKGRSIRIAEANRRPEDGGGGQGREGFDRGGRGGGRRGGFDRGERGGDRGEKRW